MALLNVGVMQEVYWRSTALLHIEMGYLGGEKKKSPYHSFRGDEEESPVFCPGSTPDVSD